MPPSTAVPCADGDITHRPRVFANVMRDPTVSRPGNYNGSMKNMRAMLARLRTRRLKDDEFLEAWVRVANLKVEETRRRYAGLFEDAIAVFSRIDPAGIGFPDSADEYDPEVGTILPRLDAARSEVEVRAIVDEEMVRWFGERTDPVLLDRLARELWPLWTDCKHWSRTR